MTTKILVDAHAGWDVEVECKAVKDSGEVISTSNHLVKKFTVQDFYIHSNMVITSIKEVKPA
jgi:hypothetical protein